MECSICLEEISESDSVALVCGHRFHAACLAQMAGAVGTAATTSRRGTLTACPNCRKVSRVAPLAPVVAAFGVGDRVHAMWGHKWFPGVVDEVVDGGRAYEIAWDDGDLGEVTASRVRMDAWAPVRSDPDDDGEETAYEEEETQGRPVEGVDSSDDEDDDEAWSPRAPAHHRGEPATVADASEGAARTSSSRFWGVHWNKRKKKWTASYYDKDDKKRHIGVFDDEDEAARAYDKVVRDAKLERSAA